MAILGLRGKAKTGQKGVVRGVVSKRSERAKKGLGHSYPIRQKTSFLAFVGTSAGAAKIKRWRLSVGLSAKALASRLGHDRSYVKHLESVKRPWVLGRDDALKLEKLSQELKSKIRFSQPKTIRVYSRFVILDGVVNLVRPRRCRGHEKVMLFPNQNQVYCDLKRECQRLWHKNNQKGIKQ